MSALWALEVDPSPQLKKKKIRLAENDPFPLGPVQHTETGVGGDTLNGTRVRHVNVRQRMTGQSLMN